MNERSPGRHEVGRGKELWLATRGIVVVVVTDKSARRSPRHTHTGDEKSSPSRRSSGNEFLKMLQWTCHSLEDGHSVRKATTTASTSFSSDEGSSLSLLIVAHSRHFECQDHNFTLVISVKKVSPDPRL